MKTKSPSKFRSLTDHFWIMTSLAMTILSGCNADLQVSGLATASESSTGAPTAPTGLTVASTTDSSILFTWTDQATDELFYEVERCSGASCASFTALANSPYAVNSASLADTGLTAGTIYRYRVRARNGSGDSDWLVSSDIQT